MSKTYSNKKLIIIGYNKEWKKNTNMGTENNMKFNKIPYMTLINKLKTKFIEMDKKILLTEESYTSKCDALTLEEIKHHEQYMGQRIKRGLYESGKGKLINADLDGAINIMRKIFVGMKEIKGNSLCNIERIKIFHEV